MHIRTGIVIRSRRRTVSGGNRGVRLVRGRRDLAPVCGVDEEVDVDVEVEAEAASEQYDAEGLWTSMPSYKKRIERNDEDDQLLYATPQGNPWFAKRRIIKTDDAKTKPEPSPTQKEKT